MLNAILRTNLQNQAVLRTVINYQALQANYEDPQIDVDQFKRESAEYSNEWLKEILADVVTKL